MAIPMRDDELIIIVPNHINTVLIPYYPPLDFSYPPAYPGGEIPRAEITYYPQIDRFLPRVLPDGRSVRVVHQNSLSLN